MKEKKLKNLKPYKKGQSGNLKGRPKGSLNFKTIFKKIFSLEIQAKDFQGQEIITNIANVLVMELVKKGLEGNLKALEIILMKVKVIDDGGENQEEIKKVKKIAEQIMKEELEKW